jgi:F-type H+-transporting ATPase subunit epsilon
MADKVQFELVSPERLLVSREVEMVVVPGSEGDFGVLPDHAPMISTVRPGTIEIHEGGQVVEQIFVAGGFAEVTGERCTVLADEATPVKEIDKGAVQTQIDAAKGELAAANDDATRERIAARLDILDAKLAAAA